LGGGAGGGVGATTATGPFPPGFDPFGVLGVVGVAEATTVGTPPGVLAWFLLNGSGVCPGRDAATSAGAGAFVEAVATGVLTGDGVVMFA